MTDAERAAYLKGLAQAHHAADEVATRLRCRPGVGGLVRASQGAEEVKRRIGELLADALDRTPSPSAQ